MRTCIIVLILSCVNTFAQVGINTTTPRAALEVEATDGGILIPRVALTSDIDELTVINPQGGSLEVSTLVYNTATAGTGINAITPGFYYWNGVRWLALGGDESDWTIFGNFDIDPDVHFIGTRNNADFRVRTNNSQRFNFTNNGRLRAYDNGSAGQPTYSWNGDSDTGIFRPAADNLAFSTNGSERMRIFETGNVGINTTISPARLTIMGDRNSPSIPGTTSNGVLRIAVASGEGIDIGKGNASSNFAGWIQSGFSGNLDPLSLQPMGGNVGIGTTNPSNRLHIISPTSGALRIVDGTQAVNRVLTSDANGVATWQDVRIRNVTGVRPVTGINIPSTTTNYLRTGCTITLPPGRWAVNVTMLMSRSGGGSTPNNSSFWLRTSFTTLNQATLTQAELNSFNDIEGGLYISGNYAGSARYGLVQGMVIINNTSAGNRTYYYVAGSAETINSSDTLANFGSASLGENVITAYRL